MYGQDDLVSSTELVVDAQNLPEARNFSNRVVHPSLVLHKIRMNGCLHAYLPRRLLLLRAEGCWPQSLVGC